MASIKIDNSGTVGKDNPVDDMQAAIDADWALISASTIPEVQALARRLAPRFYIEGQQVTKQQFDAANNSG